MPGRERVVRVGGDPELAEALLDQSIVLRLVTGLPRERELHVGLRRRRDPGRGALGRFDLVLEREHQEARDGEARVRLPPRSRTRRCDRAPCGSAHRARQRLGEGGHRGNVRVTVSAGEEKGGARVEAPVVKRAVPLQAQSPHVPLPSPGSVGAAPTLHRRRTPRPIGGRRRWIGCDRRLRRRKHRRRRRRRRPPRRGQVRPLRRRRREPSAPRSRTPSGGSTTRSSPVLPPDDQACALPNSTHLILEV